MNQVTRLRRRIAYVGAIRSAAHDAGDIARWARAADIGGRLRDRLLTLLT